jgi:hypothetical protein
LKLNNDNKAYINISKELMNNNSGGSNTGLTDDDKKFINDAKLSLGSEL